MAGQGSAWVSGSSARHEPPSWLPSWDKIEPWDAVWPSPATLRSQPVEAGGPISAVPALAALGPIEAAQAGLHKVDHPNAALEPQERADGPPEDLHTAWRPTRRPNLADERPSAAAARDMTYETKEKTLANPDTASCLVYANEVTRVGAPCRPSRTRELSTRLFDGVLLQMNARSQRAADDTTLQRQHTKEGGRRGKERRGEEGGRGGKRMGGFVTKNFARMGIAAPVEDTRRRADSSCRRRGARVGLEDFWVSLL